MGESHRRAQWSREQDAIRTQIITEDNVDWTYEKDQENQIQWIGGLDISFFKTSGIKPCDQAIACLVVLSYPDLQVVYEDYEDVDLQIPYIPGYLAFRECPSFQQLLQRVALTQYNPQLLMIDGNGVLHPRGCGSASHLGVLSGYPTIGVAKTLMSVEGLDEKTYKGMAKAAKPHPGGSNLPLIGSGGETLGAAVFGHGQGTVVPIYVSIGHRVSLQTAVAIVITCSKFRMPEPIRQADLRSRRVIKKAEGESI